jgi:glutathione S-transferase
MRVYGSKISYYTGKLEAYLRYKGIAYQLLPSPVHRREIRRNVGAMQMPVVERSDGRWMSDSTPILLQLETEHPSAPILPGDEVVRFIAMLMEDYADEWLWRPAMHYRWSYAHDRELASSIFADELTSHVRLPRFAKRRLIQLRQRVGFVIRDGVTKQTREHVEAGYFAALDNMTRMLEARPYLLGDSPSIADFGFMAPMLRHFGQDPTPAELMRERAPAVYAWVARVWNAKPRADGPRFVDSVPEAAGPMLREVCETHLRQLAVNAEAFGRGARRFRMRVQGCQYESLPISRYRVACLERLRAARAGLSEPARAAVRALLPHTEADILWDPSFQTRSGYDEAGEAPFNRAINVYANGVPR